MYPLPMPPPRTDNGRRRLFACRLLTAAVLDGIDDDTLVIGITVITTGPTGEVIQHSAGLSDGQVRRHLIPPSLRGELNDLAGKLVDLGDLPEAPDSPGWLP